MIRHTRDLGPGARAGYDCIIDVRSPAEFAEDHVPGAVNLPVLDDAERAEVGTLYVQTSRFLARRSGAAKVARNIAGHLDGALADRVAGFAPLVYCWRGGQRSGAMASVMQQIGWPVTLLEGGYKSWRRLVVAHLYPATAAASQLTLLLLDGRTGSGKTDVLARLGAMGQQTLDLEQLADHRGSLFGATAACQPSQKQFETRLFSALEQLDPARPVVVEAESSRIGNLALPPALWAAMQRASRITLSATPPDRTRHILSVYGDIASDRVAIDAALVRLPSHHSRETIANWRQLAASGDTAALVSGLIDAHYDPAYDRHAAGRSAAPLAAITLDLSPGGLDRAAEQVAAFVQQAWP